MVFPTKENGGCFRLILRSLALLDGTHTQVTIASSNMYCDVNAESTVGSMHQTNATRSQITNVPHQPKA